LKVGDLVVLANVPGIVCSIEKTEGENRCAACYKAEEQEIRYWIQWSDGPFRWICQSDVKYLDEVISK